MYPDPLSSAASSFIISSQFRFLNELIKMVSPKYYADTPNAVKERIYCMFVQWNFSLVNSGKVREAYQMLVKQGVVFPTGVRQLRHHFGPGFTDFSSTPPHTRHVICALLSTHVHRMLIGACNPVACPIRVFRYPVLSSRSRAAWRTSTSTPTG